MVFTFVDVLNVVYGFYISEGCVYTVTMHSLASVLSVTTSLSLRWGKEGVLEVIPLYSFLTVHEKTSYKLKIAILDNTRLKMQTLCYFMLKSDLPNRDKITSVKR